MGKRGPQGRGPGYVKWGLGPRVRVETREYMARWCEAHGVSISALVARLLEDEHARLLIAELDEETK